MIVKGSLSYTGEQWEALELATSDAHDSVCDAVTSMEEARKRLLKGLNYLHLLGVDEKLPDHLISPEVLAMESMLTALTDATKRIEQSWAAWVEVGYEQ